jgi:aminopeptidase N
MRLRPLPLIIWVLCTGTATWGAPRAFQKTTPPASRADILRGEYGRYRANNDLLSYDLDIRVDPEKKFVSGKNTIRFRMLGDDSRIQLDLFANLDIEKILLGATALKYTRELNTVFVDFPRILKKGSVESVDFYYSGFPKETGRFGGISFKTDPAGRAWITTACQGVGASVWWPNKDQQRDEVENMRIRVAIPSTLSDVSNGRFVGKTDLGDGYTRYEWAVHYPINNYCVSLNIGTYEHFSDNLGDLTMDFYCLPENLERAKKQFAQARPMIEVFQNYFGAYPFKKDGYKLIEVPYSGMEHQSAVTYGNRFANGYLERDWTGVGVSLKFDFIIIHESAHEWFGNSITASDVSDEWIHEGWATYAECVYVEAMFGAVDALKYVNGYKAKVKNQQAIITARGVNASPTQDQYFKGALFLNTLRSVIDDDARWWELVRDYSLRFRYHNILTEDMVSFFNDRTGMNLTPIFDQYLRQAALPALELRFEESGGTVSYRWRAGVKQFAMPVRVGRGTDWQVIVPTTEWKTMKTDIKKEEFEVATDRYYIDVIKD